jgi:hypothetical protein
MLETLENNEAVLLQRLANYMNEARVLNGKLEKGRSPPEKQGKRQMRLSDLQNRLIPNTHRQLSRF